ncbi:MAG: hypothetical protein ACRYGM_24290 [Janthinobacterium lividum]
MKRLLLLLLLPLAACGALPQPFFNNPGLAGMRLSEPPASRLAVPTPAQSLLPDEAAEAWARATADALVEQEIPAAAGAGPKNRDWTLRLEAQLRGESVVPSYTVLNPQGQQQGATEGKPVAARAWANADPATLRTAAAQAAPGIAALLGTIEAARRQSDPNSLVNRPARIYLAGVSGAPGDGNRSLPAQLTIKLTALGLVVQDNAKGADYKVEGEVQTAPGANGTARVELQWIVSDARSERGRIVQINEVPPRTVVPYWGDVAVAVAAEAAAGVRQVITNASGIKPKEQ